MSRRRSKSPLEQLIILISELIAFLVYFIYRFILFTYDLITFYTSGYKKKSGNIFLRTYFNKGNYGEFVLYRKVIRIFKKEYVLTNIYLEGKNTDTTEIDVLAISTKGIYVFEMKNYAGYIYGSEKDTHWTQVLNLRTKHKFYNPIRQNYAHTKALEKYLGVHEESIIPMVVFSNGSKLKKINVQRETMVLELSDSIKHLKRAERFFKDTITPSDIEKYLGLLLDKTLMDEDTKNKHIEQVKMLKSKSLGEL
ncbi:hypothetical protein BK011_09000 [Tenericutes bacterium MZ-XQ]|nr:hypothetical protein BK011_09000 [Tenericutes bacterium MZ-XQ]